jgi:hypothetical protein
MQWIKVSPQSKPEEKAKVPVQLEAKKGSGRLIQIRTRGRRQPRKGKGKRKCPSLPPELESVTIVAQVVRYVVQASPGTTITINSAQLQAAQGGIVTVNTTTMTGWASSVKVTRICIWPAASASASTITGPELVWANAGVTDLVRDESKINTLPAGVTGRSNPVDVRPPAGTVSALWHHYDGSQHDVFSFNNLVQGTIIDVHTVFTLANNLTKVTLAIGTSLLGTVGWPYLDSSNAKLLPVGKPLVS